MNTNEKQEDPLRSPNENSSLLQPLNQQKVDIPETREQAAVDDEPDPLLKQVYDWFDLEDYKLNTADNEPHRTTSDIIKINQIYRYFETKYMNEKLPWKDVLADFDVMNKLT